MQVRKEAYEKLERELRLLLGPETNWLANLANTSALLWQRLEDINWVGFYLLEGDELVLGPFQGKPACVRIALGRGVCGTSAQAGRSILVPDVRQFPGHIACDAASRSEIVLPMITKEGELIGVLDVDSPSLQRFGPEEERGLTAIVNTLMEKCDWER